jgi:membrane protease YdiL (CAAX protease family)
MDAADHTEAQVALPGLGRPERRAFPVGARTAFIGLLVAAAGTLFATILIAIAFTAAGVGHLNSNHAFVLVVTLVQDAVFVITAYALTAERSPVTPRTFGLNAFGPSAIGTMALAFGAYFLLSAAYSALVAPPCDNRLPDDLGIHESAFLATLAGIFVIGVAPVAEEFFFRGFIFQALRRSWGVWLAAPASGVIFAAAHFQLDKLVPLAILGTALAYVFHRTRSLYPCILLHALNNTVAFIVLLGGSGC